MALRRSRSTGPSGASRSNAARATSRWSVLTATATSSSRSSSLASAATRTARCIDRRATAPIAFWDSSRSRADRLTDSTLAIRATSPRSRASDNPGQGGLALVELRRLDGNRPQHRERLVPHLIVGVGPRDTADRRGVRQPGDRRQPHPGSASSDAMAANTSWASSSRLSTAAARTDGSSCCQPGWPRNRSSKLMRLCGPVQIPVVPGAGGHHRRPRWTASKRIMHTRGQKWRIAVIGGRIGQPRLDGWTLVPGTTRVWI